MLDNFLYIILPYTAFTLAVVGTALRFARSRFSVSSLSSQFLESDELFYGAVSWHLGIIVILIGHLIGYLFPKQLLAFNGVPVRLYLLESTALLFGLLALVGIISLIVRRLTSPRIRAVTTAMDLIVLLLLLVQVGLGVYTALFYRWGSSWYASSAVPYLHSLIVLQPNLTTIAPLPLPVKLHILNAYLLLTVFPFSRLVHMLVLPLHYLWRPYQLVVWNWDRRRIRGQAPRPAMRPARASSPVVGEDAPANRPAVSR